MPFLLLSAFLLFASYPFVGTTAAVWLSAGSQFALLLGEIRKRQVSGVGAFIFMSFLFFGVRPLYMVIENDYKILVKLFKLRADLTGITEAMWWGSAATFAFAAGAFACSKMNRRWMLRRRAKAALKAQQAVVSDKIAYAMLAIQFLTLPLMFVLAKSGRGLYRSDFGAYAYDLPVPLQSLHIITIAVLLERYLRRKTPLGATLLGFSIFLFIDFTWLMREVSMFRGFYIAGLMIAGIAVLQRIRGRVGYTWLIIPIVVLQPFFHYLGVDRYAENEDLAEQSIVTKVFGDRSVVETYWRFYDSQGDMNIFDTFVAAKAAEPAYRPYLWSWLYVPLHFVPRAFWPGKPKRGITQDLSFMRGAPYCPGIAGFFMLDGGLLWMLLSMAVLGFLLATLDGWVFTLPRGYLQYCLVGIVSVNAMFLARFFLWQYFYQMLYAMVPCLILAWWFGRSAKMSAASARNQRRSAARAAEG